MRNAETVLGIIQERSHEGDPLWTQLKASVNGIGSLESYVTRKSVMRSSEGGRGKVPIRVTRCGLPYVRRGTH